MTLEEHKNTFIEKAKLIHNNKYDYSKAEYINYRTKICIICPIHGEFLQEIRHHLYGIGCPKCGKDKVRTHNKLMRLTNEEFINKAKVIHKDKYDYSKVEYKSNKINVCVICPEHGEFFVTPNNHISKKSGCPMCNMGKLGQNIKFTQEGFIEKANEIHHNKYDHSKVNYINIKTKIHIICPIHGEFLQMAGAHLNGEGCPKCKTSKLENIVLNKLKATNIPYIYQYRMSELGKRSLDFFLPKYNIAIECQGEQHYIETDFSNNKLNNKNLKLILNKIKQSDEFKFNICKKNNIKVIYFTIPEEFRKKGIKIYEGFYNDKLIFTKINNLISYVLNNDN